jgi:glycosyltransferase involved in cell wall biosynthesis
MPEISIIIPHFNRADLLRETLDSLYAQSESSWEAVVVDDQSSREQWETIRDYADGDRIRLYRREDQPRGAGRCRNLALAKARGEFVIFLDSDDILAPWCLEQRLAAWNTFDDLDFLVFPAVLFHDRPGDRDTLWNRFEPGKDLLRFLRSDPPWCITGPLWRRQSLDRLGGFNETLRFGIDGELYVRALLRGFRYHTLAGALPDCFVRRNEQVTRITSGMSDDKGTAYRLRLREFQRLIDAAPTLPPEAVQTWQGAYIAAAESLLFNHPTPAPHVRAILADMAARAGISKFHQWIVRGYFAIALATRNRAYLLLRITRRLAALFSPRVFFRRPKTFCKIPLPAGQYDELRKRLG